MSKSGGIHSRARVLKSNGMDHTFSNRNNGSGGNNTHYVDFVKRVERQRCIQEFESGNERRLQFRRNGGPTDSVESRQNVSSHYIGNSKYTSRPPTGVDLALGLNGYKDPRPLPKARVPSSLQSDRLEKFDFIKDYRSKNDSSAHWSELKSEVEERRAREEQERMKFCEETRSQMLEKDSILLREERTKQIEKKLPQDWDYQMKLKDHVSSNNERVAFEDASRERCLAEEKAFADADAVAEEKNHAHVEAISSLAESRERRFRDDNSRIDTSREEAKDAAVKTELERLEDESHYMREAQKVAAYQDVNREMIAMKVKEDNHEKMEDPWKQEDEEDFLRSKQKFEREGIAAYRENLAAIDKRRNLESGALAGLLHGQQVGGQTLVKRPDHSSLILDQITQRKRLAEELKLKRQAEEEARLEAEALFKASQLADKERRVKDQNTYREFLNKQMEEKRSLSLKMMAEEKLMDEMNDSSEKERLRNEGERLPKMRDISAH